MDLIPGSGGILPDRRRTKRAGSAGPGNLYAPMPKQDEQGGMDSAVVGGQKEEKISLKSGFP